MSEIITPRDLETAWLAGLIEGEGCITFGDKHGVAVVVQMTDEDVVRRAHDVGRVGNVTGPRLCGPHKPQWSWRVTSRDEVRDVLVAIRQWMGTRRRQRIEEALQRLAANTGPSVLWPVTVTTCRKGHTYDAENTAVRTRLNGTTYRNCRICLRELGRKTRERRRALRGGE